MTTQQQHIIDSLVAEFNKINNPIPSGFTRIGEALDKCDEWNCLVAGVEASNARFELLREEMIERDCDRLKEECRLAGINLRIEEHSDYILIDNHHGYAYNTDNAIKINYDFVKKYHHSNTNKSIQEVTSIVYQSYQAASGHWKDTFSSIENLFQDERFFSAWTKLIEISRK
jgi:hypothetical protein